MTATTSTNGGIAPESETRSTWFHGPPNIVTVTGSTAQTTSRMVRPDGSGLPLGLVASIELLRKSLLQNDTSPRYSPVDRLGSGTQGVVWRVSDRDCRRELAFKLLSADSASTEDVARFVMEAQITAQLEHPGIPPVHDIGRLSDGTLYYSMKCVEGMHLADHLAPRAGRDEHRFALLQIFLSICQTVAFAHSKGVIHRDLKPKNVMVGRYGEVLIMDWGLAKLIGDDEDSSAVRSDRLPQSNDAYETMHGTAVGTPAYMSPEQAKGDVAGLDSRCDVYSLGVMLYEMLAAVSPYERGDVQRVLRQCRDGSWTRLDRRKLGCVIPRPLMAIVHRALSLSRDQRYQTVEALADEVRAFLAGDPVSAYNDALATTLLRSARQHRAALRAGALVAGAALLLFAAVWLISDWHERAAAASLHAQAEKEEATNHLEEALATLQRLQGLRPGDAWATANQQRILAELKYRQSDQQRQQVTALTAAHSTAESQALVAQADVLVDSALHAFALSRQLYGQAEECLLDVLRLSSRTSTRHDPILSARITDLQDAADRAEHLGAVNDASGVDALESALRLMPKHRAARQAMADWCAREICRAEAHNDVALTALLISRAKRYDDDGRHTEVIDGVGHLLIPATAAAVEVQPLSEGIDHVLRPNAPRQILAPGSDSILAAGHWLVRGPGGAVQAVQLDRGEHRTIALSPVPAVPQGTVAISTASISDHRGHDIAAVPLFALAVREVTCSEYRQFLIDTQRLTQAPVRETAENIIASERPITGISARDATAYAAWRATRDGLAWRLPTRLEWCAAVQSGDHRPFPWGMHFSNDVLLGKPVDQTPNGLCDLVSSVAELTAPEPDAALTWVCGGSHRDLHPEAFSDANIRTMSVTAVDDAVGFRLALTLR